jgi:hypothetical protein
MFIILSGCQESNNGNDTTNYKTFYSNDIMLPNAIMENLSNEEINDIIELGKALSFQIDYPSYWKVEYNPIGFGIFSIFFYPENADWKYSKYITFDLLLVQPDTSKEEMKIGLQNIYTDSSEKEIDLNADTYIWRITGKRLEGEPEHKDFNQASALILYNNSEVFQLQSFFNDSGKNNMKIFNNIMNSFNKIND